MKVLVLGVFLVMWFFLVWLMIGRVSLARFNCGGLGVILWMVVLL